MTTFQRAGRAPALALTVMILAAVAVLVALSATGSSTAAPPLGSMDAAVPPAAASPAEVAPETAEAAPAEVVDPRSGDAAGQMYLDDTEARRGEMAHAYNRCLLDHGAARDTDAQVAEYQGGHDPIVIAEPVPARATSACADLEMRTPRELDPATNPDYRADAQANVDCLRDHGIAVHVPAASEDVPSGLLWTYDSASTPVPDDAAQIETACLLSTFGR